MEAFVKGLFPNVNSLVTVHRGQEVESEIEAGWFNVNMEEAVPERYADFLQSWYPANARPKVNEVMVDVDGEMKRMWLPQTLDLTEWYQISSPVVFPHVQCRAVPLWGDKDIADRTAYPFGKGANVTYHYYIEKRTEQGLVSKAEEGAGIRFPDDPEGYLDYAGGLDTESQSGFFVFMVLWNVNYADPDGGGPVYENMLFPELPPSKTGAYFTGMPCNYTLFWANVTFSNATGTMKATLDSDLELYESSRSNHTIAQTIMQTFESLRTVSKARSSMFLFDHVAHGHYGPTQTIERDGEFYSKKLSELLSIPVYANTRDAPFYRLKGARSVLYTKIQPVTTSWGISLILVWSLSTFFLWLYAVYLGPKVYSGWHVNQHDNSWNYLLANVDPHWSEEHVYDPDVMFYQDPESAVITLVKVEKIPDRYPGIKRV
jgi:hypothetical protein